jgi:hypothetical protein
MCWPSALKRAHLPREVWKHLFSGTSPDFARSGVEVGKIRLHQ